MSSLDDDDEKVLEEMEDFEYGIDEWIYNNYTRLKKIIPFNEEIKKLYLRRFPPENVLWRIAQNIDNFIALEDVEEEVIRAFWKNTSSNPNITWEIIRDNPEYDWDSRGINQNPNITWEIIRDNPGYDWDWYWVSDNPNITWEIIRDNLDKYWDWDYLSQNPNITWEIIEANPDKDWDWFYISQNPNITWEIIRDNPDNPWNWWYVSQNPNITWEIIQANSDKDWDWYGISKNPNITWEIIRDAPDKPWRWDWVSENPNITWEIIQNNPDKDWDWIEISANPNITWEIIKNNPDKDWNWRGISANPNITWDIITENKEKINVASFASNKFQLDDHVVFKNYIRDVVLPKKKNLIKKALSHNYYKPNGTGYRRAEKHFYDSIKELEEKKEDFSFRRKEWCLIPLSIIRQRGTGNEKRVKELVRKRKIPPITLKYKKGYFEVLKGNEEVSASKILKATHIKAYMV